MIQEQIEGLSPGPVASRSQLRSDLGWVTEATHALFATRLRSQAENFARTGCFPRLSWVLGGRRVYKERGEAPENPRYPTRNSDFPNSYPQQVG
jgi:hypothetical protein